MQFTGLPQHALSAGRRLGRRRFSAGVRGIGRVATLAATLIAIAAAAPAMAEPNKAGNAGIYTCVDANGKRWTADRPIRECLAREQQLLNRDGSMRARVPPSMTADERAEQDARERKLAEVRTAFADAGRRDRNLIGRYPDEPAHQRAREAALDTVRLAIKASELRLKELANERKPLLNEAEFYEGRTLPPKLRQALDANDGAAEAQRDASRNQESELGRINRLYDIELGRLRRLWAGAPPGSLGPLLLPQGGSVLAAQPAPSGTR